MDERLLDWVKTRTAALGIVLTLGSLVFLRLDVTLGVAVGALLAVANLWALVRVGRRLVAGPTKGRAAASVTFFGKFVLLGVAVFALIKFVPMDLVALMVGFSTVVLVIVAGSLFGPPPADETDAGGETPLGLEER